MKQAIQTGALIAAAAAAMALSGVSYAADTASSAAKVHCSGINSCKGQSDCKTAENACKGQNSCKGHGFVATTAAECKAKNGKITE
ncbi:MAG: hypothetical protein V4488_23765 [Pseudomonadota bacterium]